MQNYENYGFFVYDSSIEDFIKVEIPIWKASNTYNYSNRKDGIIYFYYRTQCIGFNDHLGGMFPSPKDFKRYIKLQVFL